MPASALDSALSYLHFLSDYGRDIVWGSVEEGAEPLLVLPQLSEAEQNLRYHNEGCIIPGSAATVRCDAFAGAFKLLLSKFEGETEER